MRLVRKSSSINDETQLPATEKKDSFQELMSSPAGQAVMLETDFSALFNKILTVLTILLSKTNLVFEDKIIIENGLSIIVGTMLFKNDTYTLLE